MKPLKLSLSGWGPYKDSQTIDFAPIANGGLFLITGATGAGKTTVFDAVTFALYGEVSGSVREKDSLRSDFAAPDMATQVELVFVHRGETYRVLRNPRYDRAKLRGEGTTTENENAQLYREDAPAATGSRQETLVATGSGQVSEAVTEVLGLDYRQFKQISMIAQGEFMQLLTASSKERTLIFRDIFETKLYDTITQILNQQVLSLKRSLEEIKHRMDEVAGTFRMESEVWEKLWNQKSRNYPKMTALVAEDIAVCKAGREALELEQDRVEREYKSLIQKTSLIQQNNQMIDAFLAEEARLTALLAQMQETAGRKKELQKEAKKLPAMEKEAEKLQETIRALEAQCAKAAEWKQAKLRLAGLQERYLKAEKLAKEKKAAYELQEDRYRKASAGILAQNLTAGMPCPVCGSMEHPAPARLTEEIPDEKRLERLKAEAEQAGAQAGQAHGEAATAVGVVRQLEEGLGEPDAQLSERLQRQLQETREKLGQNTRARKELEQACRETELLLARQKATVKQKKEGLKKPKDMEKQDVTEWKARVAQQEARRRQLAKEKGVLETRLSVNRAALGQMEEHLERREKLEEEYGNLRKVERAASGSNNRKLVLEQYVLSVYFEDILRAANQRLRGMTGERYELYRSEEGKDRRMKEGMELEVLDQYTGRKRSVRSLSGGESFKAALALALGTSDVVQSYAGGIQVETLFVDEGFGALDSESMTQAMDILSQLGDNRRMIGIISHVEELKERIENQIIIEKTNNGSSIKTNFAVYCPRRQ